MNVDSFNQQELQELFSEAAHALREYHAHPYGPAVTDEMRDPAYAALSRICAGDQENAQALARQIVEDLGGYMPRAVVLALLRVSRAVTHLGDIEAPEVQ